MCIFYYYYAFIIFLSILSHILNVSMYINYSIIYVVYYNLLLLFFVLFFIVFVFLIQAKSGNHAFNMETVGQVFNFLLSTY